MKVSSLGFIVAAVLAVPAAGRAFAQDHQPPTSIVGAWSLNKDRSDQPPAERQPGDRNGRGQFGGPGGGGRRGGGFGGGGRRGGGFGGGFGGGGRGGPDAGGNPEDMQRRRNAMRDLLDMPDHLTITRTDSMVIVTSGDGRTTRLATNNKKVKDDSTGIERKTRWDGDRLVSEISGAGRGKIVETYAVDPESHELVVTLQMDGNNNRPDGGDSGNEARGFTRRRVYDTQQP